MKWIVLYRTLFENALFKMFNHYMYVLLIVMLIIIDDAIARVTYIWNVACVSVCGSFCHLSSRVQCYCCNWCCFCVEYLAVFFSVCMCMRFVYLSSSQYAMCSLWACQCDCFALRREEGEERMASKGDWVEGRKEKGIDSVMQMIVTIYIT